LNNAKAGDTINISAGSATWSTQVTASTGVNLIGATTCTGTGDPNIGGGVISCTDNTNITLSVDEAFAPSIASGQFMRISGVTWTINYVSSHGLIAPSGNHGQVNYRIDHNHFVMPASDSDVIYLVDGYGLVDHNYFQDATTSGSESSIPVVAGGDFPSHGEQNWNDATNLGTNQGLVAEQNYFVSQHLNTEGFFDCYFGAKITVRFNTVVGTELGGCHGTDTGYPFFGAVVQEVYGNSATNSTGTQVNVMNVRSGATMAFGNSFAGSTPWNSLILQYLRYGYQNSNAVGWGAAQAGLNWIIPNASTGSWSTGNSLNVPNYQTNYAYAAGAAVIDSNGCNLQTSAGGKTGSTEPTCPAFGSTVTDNGGVIWQNVGGTTTASSMTTAGWCAVNPDTICSANSTCSALSSGDTCTRYFDANGGVYPYRDQPCFGHNQVSMPCYEWNNTGSNIPSPLFTTATSSIIGQNRDYYDYMSTGFTGALGVGSGLLASAPSTCTAGVAYFATDQGSWNQSGNGFGNGVLYQCGSGNTWTAYYTPYAYPDPLESAGTGSTPSPPTNLTATAQ